MSLGIAFKGPEGIVLAADSRVTIQARQAANGKEVLIPATYDNATKLLRINGQDHVGAVTYGMGALGQVAPRTAHSFVPEFEARLASRNGGARLGVQKFAEELGEFFLQQWKSLMPGNLPQGTPDMIFLVAGYDENTPYGRVFESFIPSKPEPKEWFSGSGEFGAVWGGQKEIVERLLNGVDPRTVPIIKRELNLNDADAAKLTDKLKRELATPIPYPFLPLQDCIDLSIFVLRATIRLQTWMLGIRGVGGQIDVATITKTGGFQPLQVKRLSGERILN